MWTEYRILSVKKYLFKTEHEKNPMSAYNIKFKATKFKLVCNE